jgi:hypothetical protein
LRRSSQAPQMRGRSSCVTPRLCGTRTDGDVGLDRDTRDAHKLQGKQGWLGLAGHREEERGRERERVEPVSSVLPTGCRPRRCSGWSRAGREPVLQGLGGVGKGMRRSSNSQERGGVRGRSRGRCRSTFIGQNGGARDMRKTTTRGDGAAPYSVGRRVWMTGESIGQGVVGRLGEEATCWRPPGVRRNIVNQSTGGSIR